MTENLSPATDANHESSLLPAPAKLLIIVTDNKNQRLKKMLQQWESDKPYTRNLKKFHPKRLNAGALIVDDTEYTRGLCNWLKTMNFRGVVVMEYNPLWEDMFD
jgi:hypothetical protein